MSQPPAKSPLAAFVTIRREELPLALMMFGQFFLIITTFWILKPIKKDLFFDYYGQRTLDLLGLSLRGAQAELLAKVLNMLVAYVAVVAFSVVSRRLQRQRLTFAFTGFFSAAFVLYGVLIGTGSAVLAWTFYLFGDLYSSLMVATFFAFLNDSVRPADARRLYGPIVLGGVAGGAFGTTLVANWIRDVPTSLWLWVCLGIAGIIAGLAAAAGRLVERREAANEQTAGDGHARQRAEPDAPTDVVHEGNPALDGARLVLRSRYLLSIVAIVGLYEIVSTVMDFQFSSAVEYYASLGRIDEGQHFATTYAITNWTALLVQALLTSAIMSRFRLSVALLVLPVAALSASSIFMFLPLVWVASSLNTADNALNYSINQSAKEALYTVTSRDEKYKAKAFIDMFVQRFAKVLAVGVSLTITLLFTDFDSVRYLTLFTLAVGVLWVLAARYAGRRFHELSEK